VSRRDRGSAALGDAGQKWASVVVSAAVVFVVGWMTVETPTRPVRPKDDAGLAAASPSAKSGDSTSAALATDGGSDDLDAGLFLATPSLGDASLLPLPTTTGPRTVKIGVVLVAYQGAEGAPASARSKRDALAMAERLGQDARTDFHHAVTGGDPGSADDIGRLPRGVLDPRTESAVFALASGEISDVLETPKGYWIVKRID
jgi:hypothetical protein